MAKIDPTNGFHHYSGSGLEPFKVTLKIWHSEIVIMLECIEYNLYLIYFRRYEILKYHTK